MEEGARSLRVLCARVGGIDVGSGSVSVSRKPTPLARLVLTVCLPPFAKTAKDGAPPIGQYSRNPNLLQAFDQVEIAERAVEAVDVSLSVGRCLDRSDSGNTGGVNGDNLLGDSFLSGS